MKHWKAVAAIAVLALLFVPSFAEEGGSGAKISWFGSMRIRPEYVANLYDVARNQDDSITWIGYRANVGAIVQLDKNISGVFEVQSLGKFGEDQTSIRGGHTIGNNNNDISFFQAYIEAKDVLGQPLTLRLGRQKMVLADGWLMGNLDFYGGTSWDGIRADVAGKKVTVSAFYMTEAELDSPERFSWTGQRGLGTSNFYGAWTAWSMPKNHKLEAGVIYNNDQRDAQYWYETDKFDYLAGTLPYRDKRFTITAHYAYQPDLGLFGVVNLAHQRGTTAAWKQVRTQDINALALELTGGWRFEIDGKKNTVYARYASYSGDKPTTDGKNESFNKLYMDFHGRYGLTDYWAGVWRPNDYLGGEYGANIFQIGFDAQVNPTFRVVSLGQFLRRQYVYDRVIPPRPYTTNKDLGSEFSVMGIYDYSKNANFYVGFSQIYPGRSIEAELPNSYQMRPAKRLFVGAELHF